MRGLGAQCVGQGEQCKGPEAGPGHFTWPHNPGVPHCAVSLLCLAGAVSQLSEFHQPCVAAPVGSTTWVLCCLSDCTSREELEPGPGFPGQPPPHPAQRGAAAGTLPPTMNISCSPRKPVSTARLPVASHHHGNEMHSSATFPGPPRPQPQGSSLKLIYENQPWPLETSPGV